MKLSIGLLFCLLVASCASNHSGLDEFQIKTQYLGCDGDIALDVHAHAEAGDVKSARLLLLEKCGLSADVLTEAALLAKEEGDHDEYVRRALQALRKRDTTSPIKVLALGFEVSEELVNEGSELSLEKARTAGSDMRYIAPQWPSGYLILAAVEVKQGNVDAGLEYLKEGKQATGHYMFDRHINVIEAQLQPAEE